MKQSRGVWRSPRSRLVNRHAFHFTSRQIEQQKSPHRDTLQRAGIDHARLAGAMLFRDVRVAVKEEVERIGVFEIVQPDAIVAVREGQRLPREFEMAPRAVQGRADLCYRAFDGAAIVIAVAEDE